MLAILSIIYLVLPVNKTSRSYSQEKDEDFIGQIDAVLYMISIILIKFS